jgi:glycine cleavage system H protein
MTVVRGCELPEDLSYNIENNIWVRMEQDKTITIGMTAYGVALAGKIVAFTPKKVGKSVKKNKSCATVESGKWVGPAKAPVGGEVVAINQAVLDQPDLINNDPYGEGWLVRIEPNNWEKESDDLLYGAEAVEAFEIKMDFEGFDGCN